MGRKPSVAQKAKAVEKTADRVEEPEESIDVAQLFPPNALDAPPAVITAQPFKKKTRKDMTPEERKEYDRVKQAECRARKKEKAAAVSTPSAPVDEASTSSDTHPIDKSEPSKATKRRKGPVMTPEEKKEFERLRKKLWRENKKAEAAVASDPPMTVEEETEEIKENARARKRSSRANLKAKEAASAQQQSDSNNQPMEDDVVSMDTASITSRRTIRDMTLEELAAFHEQEKAELRAEIEEIWGTRRKRIHSENDEPETDCGSGNRRKRQCVNDDMDEEVIVDADETDDQVEDPKAPQPNAKRNCKVRIGLIDMLDVETDGIVVPHYGCAEKSELLAKFISKLHGLDKDRLEDFVKEYNGDEFQDKVDNCGAVAFSWNRGQVSTTRQLNKQSIHVNAPIVTNKNFTVVTEASLRAAYLSCLVEADKVGITSLAFPILGYDVCPKRSAAIGVQTIFAYMHAVRNSTLQLIYIATRDLKVYERLGKFFSYVREFDMNAWSTTDYLCYERKIWDRIKEDYHFATIPGTDMVWRALKVTHDRGMQRKNNKVMEDMHEKMAKITGVNVKTFRIQRKQFGKHLMAEQFIENGVSIYASASISHQLLDIRFPIVNFCGSNEVLRKLWIYSYYHMYFQEHHGDEVDVELSSQQCKSRKAIFDHLKFIHPEVVKMWNDTLDHAPFSCRCTLEQGHHEKMAVFLTNLSCPDFPIDEWILKSRSFVFNHEVNEQFLKEIPRYKANLIYKRTFDPKLQAVENLEELNQRMMKMVKMWTQDKKNLNAAHKVVVKKIVRREHIDKPVGNETSPDDYDLCTFDVLVDNLPEFKKFVEEQEEAREKATEMQADEYAKLMQTLENRARALDVNKFVLHLSQDIEIERTIRNRVFRKRCDIINDLFTAYLPEDDDDSDDYLIWYRGGVPCNVEDYIEEKLKRLGLERFSVPSDIESYNPYDSTSINLDLDTASNLDAPLPDDTEKRVKYPKGIDIGDQKEACPHCGALSFTGERSWSCCKNGAVWIPPMKRLPKEIRPVFNKRYRNHLISTNAAFSMASVRYNRQSQSKGGIQSVKIKGMVTCHPSAVHHHKTSAPAYANFIVLNHSNEDIAAARYKTLKQLHNENLKQIFVDIQKYMDSNNRLYEAYKSMAQIEEEFKSAKEFVKDSRIKFRIVPPGELSTLDQQELEAHNGVYARPSRMGKGYITVAVTWNADSMTPLPRGMVIYPKNPIDKPQEPLSIYSDLCDLMSYPLFYPDAIGGWGLHKYKRLDKRQKISANFIDRVKAHLEELKKDNEKPTDYYKLNDAELRSVVRQAFDITRNPQQRALPTLTVRQPAAPNTPEEDSEGEIEDDPMNYSEEQHLAYGELEDLQEAPLDPTDVGQMPNLKTVERGGEVYTVVDRNQKTRDIPLVSGNPMMMDSDDEEEAPDRFKTFDEDYLNVEGLSDMEDERVSEKSKKSRRQTRRERRASDSEEVDYEHFVGADAEALVEMEAPGEDIEVAVGSVVEEADGDVEDEDVAFGDEYAAEKTAMGRQNDGVRVKNVGARQYVSLAEYAKFEMQDRRGLPCRFQGRARTLGQLYIIDLACRIREMRMNALTVKRAIFPTVTDRSALVKLYSKMLEDKYKGQNKKIGMLVTMPSTVPGTSKYQRELVMSAVTVANNLGNPHLFITFTGNPKWPEIKRACKARKCDWADIPDVVNRVFKRRYELFLEEIVGKSKKSSKHNGKYIREEGIFGPVVWYNYSVEFQQRGMPHCHLLVCLKNPITNSAQIDQFISAEVPDVPNPSDPEYEEKMDYYNLVKDLMVHTPCEGDRSAYCNKEKKRHWKKCCKDFPKKLCDHTIMLDNRYPDYRRTSKNSFTIRRQNRSFVVGSEYVVAHNRELLMKYRCHMNIEVVSSIKTMKYMFKYIHKGSDRVLLEATERMQRGTYAPDTMTLDRNVFVPQNLDIAKVRQRQAEADRLMDQAGVNIKKSERVALNDCSYMMDMSAMTACEAAWRISGFPMHGSSHIVHRGYIHEEGKDVMYTNRGVSAAQAGEMLQKKSKGMMTAWFEANQKEEEDKLPNGVKTSDLTLPEMLSYYMFDTKKQEFVLRKRDHSERIMGRIQAPQPRWLELTATRLLSQTVKGPTSWDDLRTYRGIVYETCLQAARARGLMNGDVEWHNAIDEIAKTEHPIECRRFFVSVLVHCAPANPKELWDKHRHQLVNPNTSWSGTQKTAHALRHMQFLIARHGMSLADFELGNEYRNEDMPALAPEDDIDNPQAVKLNKEEHKELGRKMYKQLNAGQKSFVDRALNLDKKTDRKRLLFVDGPGGTGKTFCYKTIYHILAGRGKNTNCVSHTGIAACLLPNGCTAHRKFSIPLEVSDSMVSKMPFESLEAKALAEMDCLIWDEICMTDWRVIHAVNLLLQQVKNSTLPFGGVLVIMGGDWRQILPIVNGVKGYGVCQYTLKVYQEWENFEKFKLTENQRAKTDPAYAQRILKIGDGANYISEKRKVVYIPEENVERRSDADLAQWVFPDVNDIESTKSAALLTVDNKTALRINENILDRLDGEVHEFRSLDAADKDTGMNVDPAVFASETPSGMPPHKLRLKVGAQVVLLRNISVEQGLCNGTRLTIKSFGDDILHCTVNNPNENSPNTVWLHRMLLSPTGQGAKSCGFKRLQYPIRLAYACTINKSQGQTLSRCGLVLHSPVFSHGQLYVAMSRVQKGADFKVWHTKRIQTPGDDRYPAGGILVRNIVYRDILRDDFVKDILESLDPPTNANNDEAEVVSISSEHSSVHSSVYTSDEDDNVSEPQRPKSPEKTGVKAFFNRLKKRVTGQSEKDKEGSNNNDL